MTTRTKPLDLPERLRALGLTSLDDLTIAYGSHRAAEDGMCVMEATAYIAGEKFSDHPKCTSEFITSLCISFNDRLPSNAERDRYLKPLIPKLIGTRTTDADDETRRRMALNWVVRNRFPAYLRLAGLTAEAEQLEQLPEIVDLDGETIARRLSRETADKCWRIRNERWNAYYAKVAELQAKVPAAAAAAAAVAVAVADADAAAVAAAVAAAAADAVAVAVADADAAADAAAAADADADAVADAAAAADADADAVAAAVADADAVAAADADNVHTAAFRAALKASSETSGSYYDKRRAARVAARAIYDARFEEWDLGKQLRALRDESREQLVQLIEAMCEVGRVPAELTTGT